jgi:transporter family protein
MYIFYAFLSAIFAAGVAILGKLGLKGLDSTLATTVRSVIMAGFLVVTSALLGKLSQISAGMFSGKQWALIVGSGIAGALSWLFYFFALQNGNAGAVSAIDRMSLVFVILLAAVFLGESLTWKIGLGAVLMALGAILIVLK